MDISTHETFDYLKGKLDRVVAESQDNLESLINRSDILRAQSYYVCSNSKKHLIKSKTNVPAESFDRLLVVKFERELIYDTLYDSDGMYVETIVTFQNGSKYGYRVSFSYDLFKTLSELRKKDEFDFMSLDLFEYNKVETEIRGGAGNRLVYTTKGTLDQKDYLFHSPAKEAQSLKSLADPNRSIRGDLEVYSRWIKEIENGEPIIKPPSRIKKFMQVSIKEYFIKRVIIFSMKFTTGDSYIKLANKLQGMLELKQEDDEDDLQKEKEGNSEAS